MTHQSNSASAIGSPPLHGSHHSTAMNAKVIRPPSTTWGYTVLDPVNKINPMLSIDSIYIVPTRAMRSYIDDASRADTNFRMHHKVCPKLCTPEGCCVGEGCRHIHVSPTYLMATRSIVDPICCAKHNCYYSRSMLAKESVFKSQTTFTITSRGAVVSTNYPLQQLSLTLAIRRILGTEHPSIDLDKDCCRLFQEGRCKWGKECSRVHFCRVAYAQLSVRDYVPHVTDAPPFLALATTGTESEADHSRKQSLSTPQSTPPPSSTGGYHHHYTPSHDGGNRPNSVQLSSSFDNSSICTNNSTLPSTPKASWSPTNTTTTTSNALPPYFSWTPSVGSAFESFQHSAPQQPLLLDDLLHSGDSAAKSTTSSWTGLGMSADNNTMTSQPPKIYDPFAANAFRVQWT
eukprot:PhF_6_TR20461/c0_g1_i1/m.29413